MAQINLLPWREEFRQEKKKEFLTILGATVLTGAVAAYLWVGFVDGQIQNQKERNGLLDKEIQNLSKQVKEIEELKQKKKGLLDRMQVIQDLEGKRSIIVHYFDEFARSVPNGVFVRKIERKGNVLTIEGVSESNNRISAFMRGLDDSEWFSSPNLKSVVAEPKLGEQSSVFSMELKMILPDENKEGESNG